MTLTLVLRLSNTNNGELRPQSPANGVETNSEDDEEHGSNSNSDSDDESSKDNEFVYGVGGSGVGDDYEDDGFVVPDIDDDDTADGENENDGDNGDDAASHDECCLCGNGGILLVCDGGDHEDGCRRCFHLACVGLENVPSGDWICSACATNKGLLDITTHTDTNNNKTNEGRKGYEFPLVAVGSTSSSRTLDENENEETVTSMERRRASKRRVILESDEDEDDN